MTTHLVTFSDESMSRSAELCVESASRHGCDTTFAWDAGGLLRHKFAWTRHDDPESLRGFGYWGWKPFIIERVMLGMPDDLILIYADAGIEFLNNVNYIIDRMDQDIFLFGNQYEHAHWCKRDVIEAIIGGEPWLWQADGNCYHCGFETTTDFQGRVWCKSSNGGGPGCGQVEQPLAFGKQVQASVIFFRVNDHTRAFVKEWLDWCLFEGGRLIDDSPSRTPNHPEFRENRHDQAILTTMAYRDGLPLHWWPAEYNDGAFTYPRGDYPDEGYPILFHHHRRRNSEWPDQAKCA